MEQARVALGPVRIIAKYNAQQIPMLWLQKVTTGSIGFSVSLAEVGFVGRCLEGEVSV